jgi:hypothetical protein
MRFDWTREDEATSALRRVHGLQLVREADGSLVAHRAGFTLRCSSAVQLLHDVERDSGIDRRRAAG